MQDIFCETFDDVTWRRILGLWEYLHPNRPEHGPRAHQAYNQLVTLVGDAYIVHRRIKDKGSSEPPMDVTPNLIRILFPSLMPEDHTRIKTMAAKAWGKFDSHTILDVFDESMNREDDELALHLRVYALAEWTNIKANPPHDNKQYLNAVYNYKKTQ